MIHPNMKVVRTRIITIVEGKKITERRLCERTGAHNETMMLTIIKRDFVDATSRLLRGARVVVGKIPHAAPFSSPEPLGLICNRRALATRMR